MPTIGVYRHVVTVENPGPPIADGDGGFEYDYVPADPPELDASIESASARALERATGGTVLTSATHLIRARYRPDITTKTRLTFEGRVFEVQSVLNVDARDVALILVCAEFSGPGPARAGVPTPPPAGGWA